MTPKSSLYRSQVLGLCGLSSSSLGRNSLWRVWVGKWKVHSQKVTETFSQEQQKKLHQSNRNILVIFYEGSVEPEVERNIFVSFWKTLKGAMRAKDKMNHRTNQAELKLLSDVQF